LVVPTLNGKLAILNLKTKKLIREITVSKKIISVMLYF
jgi:hypothetical protein